MAGIAPFFITGANAKIKLNDKTMAFAQDFSYSVSIRHIAPKVLGRYESDSIEPLSYEVTGSFSIIRYANDLKDTMTQAGFKVPDGLSNKGNGVGAWGQNGSSFATDGRADEALNPVAFKLATFFNIEVWQKVATGDNFGIARIRDCRIERADFNIAGKTAPAVQRFTFKALYVDEDSFLADFSGFSPAGSVGNQVR